MGLIPRILHGRLPCNTHETQDWTKPTALMKTNYLEDGQVCSYLAGKFNSTLLCTRSTLSSSAGNTRLTVAFLFPLLVTCNQHKTASDGEVRKYARCSELVPPEKGQRSRFLWRILEVLNPRRRQMIGHICGFTDSNTQLWPYRYFVTHRQVEAGRSAGNDPPPFPHSHTPHLPSEPRPPVVISIPLPLPLPMAIMHWCQEETRKAILTLKQFPGIERQRTFCFSSSRRDVQFDPAAQSDVFMCVFTLNLCPALATCPPSSRFLRGDFPIIIHSLLWRQSEEGKEAERHRKTQREKWESDYAASINYSLTLRETYTAWLQLLTCTISLSLVCSHRLRKWYNLCWDPSITCPLARYPNLVQTPETTSSPSNSHLVNIFGSSTVVTTRMRRAGRANLDVEGRPVRMEEWREHGEVLNLTMNGR